MWLAFVIAVASSAFCLGVVVGACLSTVSKCEEVQQDSFEATWPDGRDEIVEGNESYAKHEASRCHQCLETGGTHLPGCDMPNVGGRTERCNCVFPDCCVACYSKYHGAEEKQLNVPWRS